MACLLRQSSGQPLHFDDWDMPPADHQALEHYYRQLQNTLERLNFLQPDNPKQTMTRLRRLFNRIRLDKMELAILQGMLTATQNYIYHTDNKLKSLEESGTSEGQ